MQKGSISVSKTNFSALGISKSLTKTTVTAPKAIAVAPNTLSGLVAWYSAQGLSVGSNISTWGSSGGTYNQTLSSNAGTFPVVDNVYSNSTAKAININKQGSFGNSTTFPQYGSGVPHTLIAVCFPTGEDSSNTDFGTLVAWGSSGNVRTLISSYASNYWRTDYWGGGVATLLPVRQASIISSRFDGLRRHQFNLNNRFPYYVGYEYAKGSAGPLYIGQWNYDIPARSYRGYVSEVIVYNRELSDSELAQVYAYLSSIYGITV
jgi:hypothetical protein